MFVFVDIRALTPAETNRVASAEDYVFFFLFIEIFEECLPVDEMACWTMDDDGCFLVLIKLLINYSF
jgi:hypothetical protein